MAIERLAVVGGGIAGWMSALALERALPHAAITLVETGGEDTSLGSFGPAQASLPGFGSFLDRHGIGGEALIARARGCFSLGAAFTGWAGEESAWFLPYGQTGAPMGPVAFHHLAARLRAGGEDVRLADYSLAAVLAAAGRFAPPSADPRSVLSSYGFGFNFDGAALPATLAAACGRVTVAGAPYRGAIPGDDGRTAAIELQSGERIDGDFFLDCTGAQALLARGALGAEFESWAEWLPCDRVIVRANDQEGVPPPYAHSGAHAAGWQRTVPLAGGQGEALFFAARHLDLPGATAFEPGRLREAWTANCVAIGAAATLVEPLHGFALHLVETALDRLIGLLPAGAGAVERAEYNRLTASEAERLRDFAILHYKTNGRTGEPMWDEARAMPVPEPLQYKLDLYASRGRVPMYDDESFDRPDWIAVLDGQGVRPRRWDALADAIPEAAIREHFARLRQLILDAGKTVPGHGATLRALGAAA